MVLPSALGATAFLVKSTNPAKNILVEGRQKASDLLIYTILLVVPSFNNFVQYSSFVMLDSFLANQYFQTVRKAQIISCFILAVLAVAATMYVQKFKGKW